jgi:cytochrome c oxidase assembly protein subunit 15
MAGNKAAAAAPTWPTLNGDWVPSTLWVKEPFRMNFIENLITIHFIHRGLAYLVLVLVSIWTTMAFRVKKIRLIPLLLIFTQVVLGICAVLVSSRIIANHWGAFEWIALLHQFCRDDHSAIYGIYVFSSKPIRQRIQVSEYALSGLKSRS